MKSKKRREEAVRGETGAEFNNNEQSGNVEPTNDKSRGNQSQDKQEDRMVKVSIKSRLRKYCSIM